MAFFFGSHIKAIDAKGRVSMPKPFREQFLRDNEENMVIFRSKNFPSLEICGRQHLERIFESLGDLPEFSKDRQVLALGYLSDASEISPDSQGRFVIPGKLLDGLGIKDEIIFAGVGSTFQAWEPKSYENQLPQAEIEIGERQLADKMLPPGSFGSNGSAG
jgi:MraZ protein